MGLVSSLFVLLLATTGILLNHGNRLGLDSRSLPQLLLSLFYSIETPSVHSLAVDDFIFSQVDGRQLFFDEEPIGDCKGELVGAVMRENLLLVACAEQLILLADSGEVVDQLDTINGLPTPIHQLGLCRNQVCWQTGDQSYSLDLNSMQWQVIEGSPDRFATTIPPSTRLRKALLENYRGDISWERWLQDLHSGRLFGVLGLLLMDLMAILFIVIASTGVVMWTLGRRRG
jgi:hypothetical protein